MTAEWILTSSLLILAVLALRGALKRRLGLRVRYGIWLLVLLRLLFPFSLGHSPLSVMNLERTPEAAAQGALAPIEPSPAPAAAGPPAQAARAFAGRPAPWQQLLWLTGAALVLLCLLGCNLSFYRRLRRQRRPAAQPGCPLPVYQVPGLSTPFLFGLFRPAIYLPPGLEPRALAHVLAHERTHFRHGDFIWALLRGACLALHWFNPLVWLAAALSRRDGELACDEGALRLLGEAERLHYGRTLLGFVSPGKAQGLLCTATMSGGKRPLQERIAAIAQRPRTLLSALVLLLATAALVAFAAFTGPRQAALSPRQAVDALEGSIAYTDYAITFTIPAGYPTSEDWNILIAGRLETDGFGQSIHLFESANASHSWKAGENYMIDRKEGYTSLLMDISLPDGEGGQVERSIDLLALTGADAGGNLERALRQAVLEFNDDPTLKADCRVASCKLLQTLQEDDRVTVYALALYQGYGWKDGEWTDVLGNYMPVAATFSKENGYTLLEYWTPEDGTYYAPSIREKFPAEIAEEAIDSQPFIGQLQKEARAQADSWLASQK